MDVRRLLAVRLHNRYGPTVVEDIIEDAASDALTDLLTYWQRLPSSQREENLVLEFALRRGMHAAQAAMHRYVQTNQIEIRSGYADLSAADADEDWEGQGFSVVDPDPTADEVAEELDLRSRARRMLGDLSEAELADWAANLFTGETEEHQARREGVSQQAISRRRLRRASTARRAAPKYGLVT